MAPIERGNEKFEILLQLAASIVKIYKRFIAKASNAKQRSHSIYNRALRFNEDKFCEYIAIFFFFATSLEFIVSIGLDC